MSYPIDINTLTAEQFAALPLVIKGESKEVRYAGNGLVVIKFLPTVYSFTSNRCATVPGSDIPRLRCSREFVKVLATAGIEHAYKEVNDQWVLAHLVMPHDVEFAKYGLPRFVPPDLTAVQIAALPVAPPIEIVIKKFLTGTTKHSCCGLAGSRVRASHRFYAGMPLAADGALPEMIVRFDWRNPLKNEVQLARILKQTETQGLPTFIRRICELLYGSTQDTFIAIMSGFPPIQEKFRQLLAFAGRDVFGLDRMPDTALPEQLADLFIDVQAARRTAFLAGRAIERFLADRNIVFYDLCLFISEDGKLVYGEISPDCGRYRHTDLGMLDKDVWRAGGSSDDVFQKWMQLATMITSKPTKES